MSARSMYGGPPSRGARDLPESSRPGLDDQAFFGENGYIGPFRVLPRDEAEARRERILDEVIGHDAHQVSGDRSRVATSTACRSTNYALCRLCSTGLPQSTGRIYSYGGPTSGANNRATQSWPGIRTSRIGHWSRWSTSRRGLRWIRRPVPTGALRSSLGLMERCTRRVRLLAIPSPTALPSSSLIGVEPSPWRWSRVSASCSPRRCCTTPQRTARRCGDWDWRSGSPRLTSGWTANA